MSWYQKILYGVDLDEEQNRQNELDAQLKALNDQKLREGDWTQSQYNQAEKNREMSYVADVNGEVNEAFGQGWDQGAANISGAINKTVGSALSTPFKILPWWLTAALLIGAFLYLGGGPMLRGILKRK